jgi:hypothetical protein
MLSEQEIIAQCEAAGYETWKEPEDLKLKEESRRYRIYAQHPETFENTENGVYVAADRIWIDNEAGMVYKDVRPVTAETLAAALEKGLKDLPLLAD